MGHHCVMEALVAVHYKFENCTELPIVLSACCSLISKVFEITVGKFAKMVCLNLGFPNVGVKLFCLRLFAHSFLKLIAKSFVFFILWLLLGMDECTQKCAMIIQCWICCIL